jgi:hypothetical protein
MDIVIRVARAWLGALGCPMRGKEIGTNVMERFMPAVRNG